MTIEEYTIYRINLIIENGGIGINDDVDNASERLFSLILKRFTTIIKNNPKIDRNTLDLGKIEFDCFGTKIKVYITATFFNSEHEYSNSVLGGGWVQPFSMLMISVPVVNGKVKEYDLYDTVQHELEHAFQNIKMGHGFGSEKLYAYAISRLYSENIYEKSLSHIIYASTRNEQDALINGLYGQIKLGKSEKPIDEIVKNSEAYIWLQNLYKAKQILKRNKVEIMPYIRAYNGINQHIDYNKFRKIANKGIKEFEWKMARLIKGAKKRFMPEYNVRPYLRAKATPRNNAMYFLKD